MAKYLGKIEIQFTVGNYGFLIYISEDNNDDQIQLIQIFSLLSNDLVYEEKITKNKDITRLISVMSFLDNLERKKNIHFGDVTQFEEHIFFNILKKSHKLKIFGEHL
jgi:hypothetical protein